ncbi:hypothetical protein F5884DRAFT_758435 [Xylogone sp. PMI_703]|nr:hypothetical protein F5884DRAFT_758435 [Xylogone sp. PMI_703]
MLWTTIITLLLAACKPVSSYDSRSYSEASVASTPTAASSSDLTAAMNKPITVISIITVSKRGEACWTSMSSLITPSSPSSSSTISTYTSLSSSATLSNISTPISPQASPIASTSSQTIPVSFSTILSSSTSSSASSNSAMSASLPTSSPSLVLSTTSSSSDIATPSSSPDCIISGHCNTYKLLACPDGNCFCGQDINNSPTCFQEEYCDNTTKCSSDDDCAENEACGVNDCCDGGAGRCLRLAVGCLNSPAATRPYWVPY